MGNNFVFKRQCGRYTTITQLLRIPVKCLKVPFTRIFDNNYLAKTNIY
jgi:hypothetical protein